MGVHHSRKRHPYPSTRTIESRLRKRLHEAPLKAQELRRKVWVYKSGALEPSMPISRTLASLSQRFRITRCPPTSRFQRRGITGQWTPFITWKSLKITWTPKMQQMLLSTKCFQSPSREMQEIGLGHKWQGLSPHSRIFDKFSSPSFCPARSNPWWMQLSWW